MLAWHLFSRREEIRLNREIDLLKKDLQTITVRIDSQRFFSRSLALFHTTLLQTTLTPERGKKLEQSAFDTWGLLIEPYVFDRQGNLITPESMTLKSRFLFKKLWKGLQSEHGLTPESATAQTRETALADVKRNQKALQTLLGPLFNLSQLAQHRGSIWRFQAGEKNGLLYWQIDPQQRLGGTISVVWDAPSDLVILRRVAAKKTRRPISILTIDAQNQRQRFWELPENIDVAYLRKHLEEGKKPWIQWNNQIWTAVRVDQTLFLAGRAIQPSQQIHLPLLFFFFLMILGGRISAEFYRWMVRNETFYVPISLKFAVLFLYAILLPMIGIGVLSFRAFQESADAQSAVCFSNAREVLSQLDEEFDREKNVFLVSCRSLFKEINSSFPLKRLKKSMAARYKKHQFSIFQLIKIDGTEILKIADPGLKETMVPIFQILSRKIIDYHLKDRLAEVKNPKKRDTNQFIQAFVDSPESGFTAVLNGANRVEIIDISGAKYLIYWNVFAKKDHPAAALLMVQKYEWAFEGYFKKRLIRGQAFGQTAFRLFAKSNAASTFFPQDSPEHPALEGLMERVRIGQRLFSEHLRIRGKSYLAFGFPGNKLEGFSLAALYPFDEIRRARQKLQGTVAEGMALVTVLALLTGLILSDIFLAPIGELSRGILAIQRREREFRLTVISKNEFGDLAQAFNEMMETFFEVSTGRIVQERLFPKTLLEAGEYQVNGLSWPATELGGDYYDYLVFRGTHILALIGDVTGHGVPAALVMAMAKSVVGHCARTGATIETTFELLNRTILETMKKTLIMSMSALWINIETKECRLYNFGHPYPLKGGIDGSLEFFPDQPAFPIGATKKVKLNPFCFTLAPGERVIFYTDGLVESIMVPDGNAFGAFQAYLKSRPRLSAEHTPLDALRHHPHILTGLPQPDDFSLLVIDRLLKPPGKGGES